MQGANSVTTKRQLAALEGLSKLREADSLNERAVRALLLGAARPQALAEIPPPWIRRSAWAAGARAALAALPGLNASQRRAVARALARGVTLWQGPPGTGKTRTLLGFLEVLCRVASTRERAAVLGPILACADTNAAGGQGGPSRRAQEGEVARGGDTETLRPHGNPPGTRAPLHRCPRRS